MAIFNNFSKVFEFIIHDHVSQLFRTKSSQHNFIKSISTVTNFVTTLFCSQSQNDSIHFDFRNAFDILPHALLHQKISNYGLSSGSFDWFLSYLTKRHSRVRYSGILSTPFVMQ
jgi:hypothetical protein